MHQLDASLLKNVAAFEQLSVSDLHAVLKLATVRPVAQGQNFYDQGAVADRFYLLLDGHIRVLRMNAAGDQIVVLHVPPEQLFGIAAALGRDSYPATAEAATDCFALAWPMTHWDRFTSKYAGFSANVAQTLGARVGEIQDNALDMATQNVEQRVARALIRLITQHGRDVKTGVEIDFPITRQNISDMTGTTLFTVSRLLSAWEKAGVIASVSRRITVLNTAALMGFAES